jgi:hypothetical protein
MDCKMDLFLFGMCPNTSISDHSRVEYLSTQHRVSTISSNKCGERHWCMDWSSRRALFDPPQWLSSTHIDSAIGIVDHAYLPGRAFLEKYLPSQFFTTIMPYFFHNLKVESFILPNDADGYVLGHLNSTKFCFETIEGELNPLYLASVATRDEDHVIALHSLNPQHPFVRAFLPPESVMSMNVVDPLRGPV